MRFVNVHTHHATGADNVIELVNQYPANVDTNLRYYSIGIHPWHINMTEYDNEIAIIQRHLSNDNCLAVGECGLDKRIDTPLDVQQPVFERQLALAQQYNKPVIIHCVAAFQELIAIKNAMQITVPMVIHGFSKSIELANQLLDNGFYLSFGKYLLRNPQLEAAFAAVPDNRFLLETDSTDDSIAAVYERAAQYRNQSMTQVCTQTQHNFSTIFNCSI